MILVTGRDKRSIEDHFDTLDANGQGRFTNHGHVKRAGSDGEASDVIKES